MGKKEEALQSNSYKEDIIWLINMGIDETYVQKLVNTLKEKQVCVSKDTAVKKLVELLLYVKDIRNKGIGEKSEEYISPEKLLEQIIIKCPEGTMGRDSRRFEECCQTLEQFAWTTPKKVNKVLLESPIVLNISAEKLAINNAILSNFKVKTVNEKGQESVAQLSEFVFLKDANALKTSPAKLFARLAYFANLNRSRTMTKSDYNRLMKTEFIFGKNFGVSSAKLMQEYPLPPHDEDFTNNIYRMITQYEKEEEQWQNTRQ